MLNIVAGLLGIAGLTLLFLAALPASPDAATETLSLRIIGSTLFALGALLAGFGYLQEKRLETLTHRSKNSER